jgi:predicted dehydrogenase
LNTTARKTLNKKAASERGDFEMAPNALLNRKLRMGLVGGGGGFIGRVHATAAALDGCAILVAGALSSDPEKARTTAPAYCIPPERAYASYQEMAEAEARLPAGERVDFVSIATPNHTHFAIARIFAEAGFNVVCDKPMTFDLAQAEQLARVVEHSGIVFMLTHNYTGYPLVRQAREMVRSGELGEVNAIRTVYVQGSLRRQRTPEQQKRIAWKADPARAGASGCFGDIGIHAYHLGRFITGLPPEQVSSVLKRFTGGTLDDYGTAVIRYANGALGTVTASRISHGRENDLRIAIDGTRGSLEWHQEEPNRLLFRVNGQPHRMYTRDPDAPYLAETCRASCRLAAGLPEGFLEAFANLYMAAHPDMICRALGQQKGSQRGLYPSEADGVDGMYFVSRCVASSQQEGAWLPLRHSLCPA